MTRSRNTESTSRSDQGHANKARPARIPMTAGGKLHVPESLKEEGYRYYWAIDRDSMLEQLENAWYEYVTDDRGEKLTVSAGKGETHYLMRTKQEYYDEDQKLQQDSINANMSDQQKLKPGEYFPGRKGQAVTRDII